VVEAVIDTYRRERHNTTDGKAENFLATLRRVGHDTFKAAANAARLTDKETA
jgi:sulfite reductase (NADPH) hemoprotein beta-component